MNTINKISKNKLVNILTNLNNNSLFNVDIQNSIYDIYVVHSADTIYNDNIIYILITYSIDKSSIKYDIKHALSTKELDNINVNNYQTTSIAVFNKYDNEIYYESNEKAIETLKQADIYPHINYFYDINEKDDNSMYCLYKEYYEILKNIEDKEKDNIKVK